MRNILLIVLTLVFAYFIKPASVIGTYNASIDTLSGGLLIINLIINDSLPFDTIVYIPETGEFKEFRWFTEYVVDKERIDELNEESSLVKLVNSINRNLKIETKN